MMGRLWEWISKRFTTSTLADPSGLWFDLGWAGSKTASGRTVGPKTAMTLPAVYSAVRVLSETVASLPLNVYRRLEPRGKEVASDSMVQRLLHDAPNRNMSSMVAREFLMSQVLLWGNGFARIERDGQGRPVALWPLESERVEVLDMETERSGQMYRVAMDNRGATALFGSRDMLHVPGMGFDGRSGVSVISMMRESIGLGLATEEFGSRFFKSGARPSGVLEHPDALTPEAAERLRESFERVHSGTAGAHKVAVLEGGMVWKTLGMPNEDAQFLETRRFTVEEVARAFRLPPHMIGHLSDATFSNIEHQGIDFVVHSIRPWLVRFEQEYNRKLFGTRNLFAEHVVDGLLRGDFATRMQGYAVGRQNGFYSTNDVLELENRNPIGPEGDIYTVQVNMQPLDRLMEPVDDPLADDMNEDILQRLARKERKARNNGGITDKFLDDHEEYCRTLLRPLVAGLAKRAGAPEAMVKKVVDARAKAYVRDDQPWDVGQLREYFDGLANDGK